MADVSQKTVEVLYKAIDQGATSTAKGIAKGVEDIGTGAKNAEKSTTGLSNNLKMMVSAAAGIFTIQKAFSFANESIAAYNESAKAATLVSVSFGEGAAEVNKFAAEMQKSKNINDESVATYASMLKNMGLTEDQMKKVLNAAADLTAGSGGMISMDSSVRNLAKTYSGLAGELGESVPALRGLTQEQLKSGAAIELISKQYAGLAEEVAQSPTGKIEQMRLQMDDMKETLGGALIPAQLSWIEVQKTALKTLTDLTPAIEAAAKGASVFGGIIGSIAENKVALGIAATGAAVIGLNGAVAAGTISWGAFNRVVAANPLGLVVVTVGSLIAGIDQLTKKMNESAEKQVQFGLANKEQTQKNLDALKELTRTNAELTKKYTRETYDYARGLEKQLEKSTGMMVRYNDATGEAILVGRGVTWTQKNLTDQLFLRTKQENDAALAAENDRKATEKQAAATVAATKAEEASAEAKKKKAEADAEAQKLKEEQIRKSSAASELQEKIARDIQLRSMSARQRELEELRTEMEERKKILLEGGKKLSDVDILLAEDGRQKLEELKKKWAEEDKAAADKKDAEAREDAKRIEETQKEQLDRQREYNVQAVDYVQQGADQIFSILDAVTQKKQRNLDLETKRQIDAVKKSSATEEEKQKKIEQIEARASQKRYEIQLQEWRNSLIASVANTALAVTKTFAEMGIAGAPFAAAVGIAGAVQTGIIASQKPERMNDGGTLSGGSSTTDSVVFYGNPGERIIDKGRTRKLNDMIDSGNVGGTNNTVNVTMPVTISGDASAVTLSAHQRIADNAVQHIVRQMEIAAEQGLFDKTRFKGVFA